MYFTDYCHKKDPPVCKNGAACGYSDKSPFYTCFCMPGFSGKYCENIGWTLKLSKILYKPNKLSNINYLN